MFKLANLYEMFKPADNPTQITDFAVIIGGTRYAGDYGAGLIVLSLVNSQVLTSSAKRFIAVDSDFSINETSIIQQNFQLDCYKRNSENATDIEAYSEALKIQEWLKSFYVKEYLAKKDAQILPNYANIVFANELIDGVFINRAIFEFSIVSKVLINEADIGIETIRYKTKLLEGLKNGD